MLQLISRESEAHWYKPDGTACYEVPRTDGKGMRTPTLRDARKLGLVPGQGAVVGVLARPGLEAWKQEQAILAALTLPRQQGESLEDFAHRVVEDAGAEGKSTARAGQEIHAEIMEWICKPFLPCFLTPHPALDAYINWHRANISEKPEAKILTEYSSASPLGFGCRIDIVATHINGDPLIVDIKTKETKPGKKVEPYETWGLQLAANALALGKLSAPRLFNVVLSRNEPGRLEVVDWSDQYEKLCEIFRMLLWVWQWQNDYVPNKKED